MAIGKTSFNIHSISYKGFCSEFELHYCRDCNFRHPEDQFYLWDQKQAADKRFKQSYIYFRFRSLYESLGNFHLLSRVEYRASHIGWWLDNRFEIIFSNLKDNDTKL